MSNKKSGPLMKVNRFSLNIKSVLHDYGFGEDQYFILKYLNHTSVDRECFLTRSRLHNNGAPIQRANQWRVVVQYLKLPLATWKRNGTGFTREDLTVGSNNVYCHAIE